MIDIKVSKGQRSGIDTIKYHIVQAIPEDLNNKSIKWKCNLQKIYCVW